MATATATPVRSGRADEEAVLIQEESQPAHHVVSNMTRSSDFAASRRAEINFAVCCTTNTVFTVYLCCRGSFETLWFLKPAAPFYVGFFIGIVAAVCGWLSIACRIPAGMTTYSDMLRRARDFAVAHKKHVWSGIGFDDVYITSLAACIGVYYVARGIQGTCPEGTSAWASQMCNPQGASPCAEMALNCQPLRSPYSPHTLSCRSRTPAPD